MKTFLLALQTRKRSKDEIWCGSYLACVRRYLFIILMTVVSFAVFLLLLASSEKNEAISRWLDQDSLLILFVYLNAAHALE